MKRTKGDSKVIPLQGRAVELRIMPPHISTATVTALADLLEQAKAGRVVGLVYAAIKAGGSYQGDVVGMAETHPVYTRGLLAMLQDRVAERMK